MEMLIILGFVIFAVFGIFGVISMLKQINRLPAKNKKPNPKMVLNGVGESQPFVKTRKRKPKTTKEWEDEFDLGGHE
jgi:hypothetical protein